MSSTAPTGAVDGLAFLSEEAREALKDLVAALVDEQLAARRAELASPRGSQAQALSVRAASTMTGLSEASIRRAIEAGELEAEKLRGRVRIRTQAFETWRSQRALRPRGRAVAGRRRTAPAESGLRVLLGSDADGAGRKALPAADGLARAAS